MITSTSAAIVTNAAIAGEFSIRTFFLNNAPILSAIASIAAAAAAFFSWKTMQAQKKMSKAQAEISTFNGVSNLIFTQKQHFYSTLNDLYGQERPWLKKKNDKRYAGRKIEWEYIHKGEIRNYMNAYEYACGLYQAGALDKQLFRDVFKDDIIFIYENDFGAGVGIKVKDASKETYEHLRKTYFEFKMESIR